MWSDTARGVHCYTAQVLSESHRYSVHKVLKITSNNTHDHLHALWIGVE